VPVKPFAVSAISLRNAITSTDWPIPIGLAETAMKAWVGNVKTGIVADLETGMLAIKATEDNVISRIIEIAKILLFTRIFFRSFTKRVMYSIDVFIFLFPKFCFGLSKKIVYRNCLDPNNLSGAKKLNKDAVVCFLPTACTIFS
jgi:hypothetical protein